MNEYWYYGSKRLVLLLKKYRLASKGPLAIYLTPSLEIALIYTIRHEGKIDYKNKIVWVKDLRKFNLKDSKIYIYLIDPLKIPDEKKSWPVIKNGWQLT